MGAGSLLGLELAQATADIIAFMIALPLGLSVLRKLKKLEAEQANIA